MNVEIESNKSVKRIEMIEGSKLSFKAPSTSSLRKTLLKSGKFKPSFGPLTNPRAQAMIVTATIATRNANGFFRDMRKAEMARPRIVRKAGLPRAPNFTNVHRAEK